MSPPLSQPIQPQIAKLSGASAPHFGKSGPIPEPPEHVPAKYREVWHKLPDCCRNFYLKPGAGCCNKMPEPSVPKLTDGSPPPAKDCDSCQLSPTAPAKGHSAAQNAKHGLAKTNSCHQTGSTPDSMSDHKRANPQPADASQKHQWLRGIGRWLSALFKGFWEDLKLLLKGPNA